MHSHPTLVVLLLVVVLLDLVLEGLGVNFFSFLLLCHQNFIYYFLNSEASYPQCHSNSILTLNSNFSGNIALS